jgi:outer membrane biogenesis lipoprotein LolB
MKKLAVLVTAIFFLAGFTANAQMHHEKSQKQGMMMQKSEMMEGCMMQGMMGQQMPMKKYMMTVNMLPGMQSKLSLSEEQTKKLIDLQTAFKEKQAEFKGDMAKNRMELQNLLDQNASVNEVRSQVEECTNIHVNMMMAAYETANKMKSVLSDAQKEQLKNMMSSKDSMMKGGMKNMHGTAN